MRTSQCHILKVYFLFCLLPMCMHVCMYTCVYGCSQARKGCQIWDYRLCELPDISAKNQTPLLRRAARTLSHRAVSPS